MSGVKGQRTEIRVLRHEQNRGKGDAIRTALHHVKMQGGRFMITIDADGQHQPRDLEKFLPLLQEADPAIVIGSRNLAREDVPGKSRLGSQIGNFWLRIETMLFSTDMRSARCQRPNQAARTLASTSANRSSSCLCLQTVGHPPSVCVRIHRV